MKKVATLFGGAINDTETQEYKDTVEIGKLLAKKGYNIKSGGYRGLMEAVSKGGKEGGAYVTGVTCASFGSTKGNNFLNDTIEAKDIFDRLRSLMDSDLFVVQKGGVGTLAEFFLIWDIIRKKRVHPPVFLIGEHWRDILDSIVYVENEFSKIIVCDTLEELVKRINLLKESSTIKHPYDYLDVVEGPYDYFGLRDEYQDPDNIIAPQKEAMFDGYNFGERVLEGVMFIASIDVYGNLSVKVDPNSESYFNTLNTKMWLKKALEAAKAQDVFEGMNGEEDIELVKKENS